MTKIGLLFVLCGSALFILPILGFSYPLFPLSGTFRILAALALIIIGTGFVAFRPPY